jgi:hypothetical protein
MIKKAYLNNKEIFPIGDFVSEMEYSKKSPQDKVIVGMEINQRGSLTRYWSI